MNTIMPPTAPVRLLQISDTHCYPEDDAPLVWSKLPVYPNRALQQVLRHASQADHAAYQAIILTGDVVQEETAASYQQVRTLLTAAPCPVYALPGNHDVPELMQTHLQLQGHIHLEPQTIFGHWHCIFLDTSDPDHNDGHLSIAQLHELETRLASIPLRHYALIFMHHHPTPFGSPWMDGAGLQQADAFWAIVSRFPVVQAVAFGHIHHAWAGTYLTSAGKLIALYGAPATCVQLTHNAPALGFDHAQPGWRELTLYADGRIETTVHYL